MTTAMNQCRREASRLNRAVPETSAADMRSFEARAVGRVDLLAALHTLPPRQREAAILFYLADLPVAGVADSMRLAEGAVKSHLPAARKALRTRLEPEVIPAEPVRKAR